MWLDDRRCIRLVYTVPQSDKAVNGKRTSFRRHGCKSFNHVLMVYALKITITRSKHDINTCQCFTLG